MKIYKFIEYSSDGVLSFHGEAGFHLILNNLVNYSLHLGIVVSDDNFLFEKEKEKQSSVVKSI